MIQQLSAVKFCTSVRGTWDSSPKRTVEHRRITIPFGFSSSSQIHNHPLSQRPPIFPFHLYAVAFRSHPVFHKCVVWIPVNNINQIVGGDGYIKKFVICWHKNYCYNNGQNLSVFIVLAQLQSTLKCTEFVGMYVGRMDTNLHIPRNHNDRSVSDIFNCCI
jgi:hypothetical protein